MVGVLGFEPRTSSLSGTRSNQLSYTPKEYNTELHGGNTEITQEEHICKLGYMLFSGASVGGDLTPLFFAYFLFSRKESKWS